MPVTIIIVGKGKTKEGARFLLNERINLLKAVRNHSLMEIQYNPYQANFVRVPIICSRLYNDVMAPLTPFYCRNNFTRRRTQQMSIVSLVNKAGDVSGADTLRLIRLKTLPRCAVLQRSLVVGYTESSYAMDSQLQAFVPAHSKK
ncbi:uncharacterized protein LACBIDRAFT_329400 [Laccaria bicolor S238N-H82]|uniref:Predicted protein n=1 Tax=Laccaria bicolor (strain S238N-H82 / ATCC MYA-4686) TaxID=486041 RepID=B0DHW3_LACBS|nr:uncharacterized protein LACBIDRAFT_329400 [Laccaria bicolor S238N-H82]EDR05904.1 predicted protein [Laccaria bicolor S238N-H82]|eukprot:XP_001883580.1 predicted protein [Laccaria bicolor S238N-H82]